ncbi:MAG: hypothetical protein ABIL58_17185 [Pseudomonadota bacterium]
MTIGYDFRQALRFVENIADDDREKLAALCRSIQGAEARLLDAAAPLMERCASQCRGICCRNINLDAIIGRGDLIYILALNPRLGPEMAACLENESLLYSADCVFLKNGVGPCIFPDDLKPDVCLTTFCGDTAVAAREIRQVKRRFMRLDLFVKLDALRRLTRLLGSYLRLPFLKPQ